MYLVQSPGDYGVHCPLYVLWLLAFLQADGYDSMESVSGMQVPQGDLKSLSQRPG
jgi:hypothetical protein